MYICILDIYFKVKNKIYQNNNLIFYNNYLKVYLKMNRKKIISILKEKLNLKESLHFIF